MPLQPRHGRRIGLAMLCALAHPVGAWTVERIAGSLKDRATVFAPARGAPQTTWRPAGAEGTLATRNPASSFGPAAGPSTLFRAAEVAPERIEITRRLLGELKARQTEQQAIVVDLPADVLFDFDKAELRADADRTLARAAELLRSYPDGEVAIHGHTDGKGSDSYNDALSLRRARAVGDRLADLEARRYEIQGHGKRRALAAEVQPDGRDDPEGRQRNRRVEIVIGAARAAR